MQHPEADTQTDVDILILDYILCIGIDQALHAGGEKSKQHSLCGGTEWLNTTLNLLLEKFPSPSTLPKGLHIKIQLFKFIMAFNHYHDLSVQVRQNSKERETTREQNGTYSHSSIAASFITLCSLVAEKALHIKWCEIASQICTLAALTEHQKTVNKQMSFDKYIAENSGTSGYITYIQLPADVNLETYTESVINTPPQQMKIAMFGVLTDIMKVLDPPILTQLERGKLSGLSRAQTQRLKDKIGW